MMQNGLLIYLIKAISSLKRYIDWEPVKMKFKEFHFWGVPQIVFPKNVFLGRG